MASSIFKTPLAFVSVVTCGCSNDNATNDTVLPCPYDPKDEYTSISFNNKSKDYDNEISKNLLYSLIYVLSQLVTNAFCYQHYILIH